MNPERKVSMMTPQEIAARVEGRKVIRHNGAVFVNAQPGDDLQEWQQLGATVRTDVIRGISYTEIHLEGMLPPPQPDETGEIPPDNRRVILLDFFRERDGYEWPARAEWATA